MVTGYHFRISFKERMERNDKKGYFYCVHCNDFVSRSTFERHKRKRNETNLTDTFGATSNSRDPVISFMKFQVHLTMKVSYLEYGRVTHI